MMLLTTGGACCGTCTLTIGASAGAGVGTFTTTLGGARVGVVTGVGAGGMKSLTTGGVPVAAAVFRATVVSESFQTSVRL